MPRALIPDHLCPDFPATIGLAVNIDVPQAGQQIDFLCIRQGVGTGHRGGKGRRRNGLNHPTGNRRVAFMKMHIGSRKTGPGKGIGEHIGILVISAGKITGIGRRIGRHL